MGGEDSATAGNWRSWLTSAPLFTRDHDALGFYWAIDQAGVDPWDVFPRMIGVSSPDAVRATGLSPLEAMRWAATTKARTDLSPDLGLSRMWEINRPTAPAIGQRYRVTVRDGSTYTRQRILRSHATLGAWEFVLEGDVVTIDIAAGTGALQFYGSSPRPRQMEFLRPPQRSSAMRPSD